MGDPISTLSFCLASPPATHASVSIQPVQPGSHARVSTLRGKLSSLHRRAWHVDIRGCNALASCESGDCSAPTHTSYTPLSPVASRSSVALHSVSCYSGPNTSRVRPWLHRPHDSRGHVFAWPGRQCSTAQAAASLPAESTESSACRILRPDRQTVSNGTASHKGVGRKPVRVGNERDEGQQARAAYGLRRCGDASSSSAQARARSRRRQSSMQQCV